MAEPHGTPGAAPADAAPTGPADRADLAAQVTDLQARLDDATQRLVRARADYDNLQRRVARDAEAERERARARVLEGFLHVLEVAAMAGREAERHPGPLSEGVRLLLREFERLLEREGVRPFGAAGDRFDAARHEAVGEEPAEGVPPGQVSRVLRPGYLLGDKVLRYATVTVAPAAPRPAADDEE